MVEKMNAIVKTIEAPDYPVTCDNCHEVGTNKSMTEHVCSTSIEPSPSRMMAERIVRAYAPKFNEKLIGAIDAALQAEREAVYSSWIEVGCGCRIEYGYALKECPQDHITFCPLHANAEKLREALKPFAKLADAYESFDGQHDSLDTDEVVSVPLARIYVGQLRAARAVLAETEVTK